MCLLLLVQDTKISSLERNIRDLEDEVQMLKTSGLLHPDDRQDEFKEVEVYKSHSKFMKNKVEWPACSKDIFYSSSVACECVWHDKAWDHR